MYIPSPGARQARAKRDGLVRTLSNPADRPENLSCSSISKKNHKQLYFHHYHQPTVPEANKQDHDLEMIPSSNRKYSSSVESSSATDDENMPQVRNSLDYLSYAIAMTEKRDSNNNSFTFSSQPLPDISELEPNLIGDEEKEEEEEEQTEELSIASKVSPPSSPITSAAKAIMMFVNNCNNSSTSNPKKSN
jgi:hypothetical protein